MANARRAVVEELGSSIKLTTELVALAMASAPPSDHGALLMRLRNSLAAIEGSRHLSLSLRGDSETPSAAPSSPRAPRWFADLLEVAPVEFRQPLVSPLHGETELIIRADPSDEIDEAWDDVRSMLLILVSALFSADLLVVWTVRRGLRPVDDIRRALDAVERGDLTARLPALDLPELDGIARQFNHMVEVLEGSREENRRLASRSLAIQEHERRHLAQELHDEMGQSLSAIRALAASVMQRAGQNDEPTRSAAAEIANISSRVYDVARGMMHRLRPVVLDEFGLKAALESLVDDWNTRHESCFCVLDCPELPEPLVDGLGIGVFRIVQEALTNIAKHAQASEARVEVRIRPGRDFRLVVSDNGCGLPEGRVSMGLGLRGIRERVETLGGQHRLTRSGIGGLAVEVELPMETSGA